ncbi:histidine triad (hit) protein, putative [Ricinus communis]|uniref:Histidine triad (Hit) protein, putative n=1 Tax=Ricinus communis TaxID=3988 RepID=B9T5H8_RICCO|nr:histidine triad (hit) protein, putative [Ricinus communis]|eukprot:XP_002533497.1 adenylylsulfatase HINT3 [Ricinus communis]
MEKQTRRLAVLSSHLCPIASFSGSGSGSGQDHASLSCYSCISDSNNERLSSDSIEIENQPHDCVFCRIIRGESPAFKLYEDDTCLCILDTSPLSHGHSLIIPKSHYPSLEATPPSVVAAMCSKVPFIGNAIMRATGSDSFNLLVNNGAAAGQVIFHTHIHIIPRKESDCLWTSESIQRRPLNFDHRASQLVNLVREQLSNISEDGGKGQESSLS